MIVETGGGEVEEQEEVEEEEEGARRGATEARGQEGCRWAALGRCGRVYGGARLERFGGRGAAGSRGVGPVRAICKYG